MIDKLIEQQEIIKGMQENEESAIKIMKMYEDYKLRVDKAIEYLKDLKYDTECCKVCDTMSNKVLKILKGEDK